MSDLEDYRSLTNSTDSLDLPLSIADEGEIDEVDLDILLHDIDPSFGGVMKRLLKFVPPRMIYGLVTTSYIVTRAAIMAAYDTEALAGNQACFSFEILVYATTYGTLAALQPQLTKAITAAIAEHHQAEVGVIYRSAFVNAGLTLPVIAGICFAAEPFMRWTQQPPIAVEAVKEFYGMAWPAFMMDFLVAFQNNTLTANKQLKISAAFALLNTAIYLGTAYVFVLGKLGLESQGFRGLAAAMLLSRIITLSLQTSYLFCSETVRPFHLFYPHHEAQWINISVMKRLAKKGGLSALQGAFMCTADLFNGVILGQKGTNALIAKQTAGQFSAMLSLPVMAISDVVQLLTSEAVGIQSRQYLDNVTKIGIGAMVGYAVCVGGALAALAVPLCRLVLSDTSLAYTTAVNLLMINALGETINAMRSGANAVLYGQMDMQFPLLMSVLFTCILSSILTYTLREQSVELLVGSQIVGTASAAAGAAWRLYRDRQQPLRSMPVVHHPVTATSSVASSPSSRFNI